MNEISIQLADWEQDKQQLLNVRRQVFIHEQQVPEELEIDDNDIECLHVKALDDQNVIGTARLLPNHYVGRMCVLKDYRNQGIGGLMLSFLIQHARQHGLPFLALNAQISALSFYQQYGFVENSDIFVEAGIEHIHMTLPL